MEFLPHTQEALDEYVSLADPGFETSLMTMGDSAARIVPECVGLSLTLYDDDLTFTLVAPGLPRAGVEARSQHDAALGAPAVRDDEETATEAVAELLDEDRWALFARASAAAGVASSLSLPLVERGRVVGGINLYASSSDAFAGHHGDLASALGASAAGAVTNADLAFATRLRAEQAPQRLREQQAVEVGVGILAAQEGLDVETARRRLGDAAIQAGITDVQAALVLIRVHRT
ncbi:GAF domain-containing protein [Nocardioides sp. P5_C9_2]